MLARVLFGGIALDVVLAAYGFAAYPSSGEIKTETLLLEILLIIVLFLYLFAALFGTREYDRVDRWIHRQGLIFGFATGVLLIGEVVTGSLGDTPVFGDPASTDHGLLQAIGVLLIASACCLMLIAAVNAGLRTGQVTAGIQAGLWSALIGGLMTFAAVTLVSYFLMGALQQSPTNLSDFTASGETNLAAYLVEIARVAGTLSLALGLPLGAGLGVLGGLAGKSLARMRR